MEAGTLDDFGARLRAARQVRGLTQQQLADACGITRPQITNIEAGRSDTSVSMLLAICAACDASADVLLGLKPPPEGFARAAEIAGQLAEMRTAIQRAVGLLQGVRVED